MKLKYFLTIIVLISIGHISRAENHTLSPELAEEFQTAVKMWRATTFLMP
jgi:hypothetical protein